MIRYRRSLGHKLCRLTLGDDNQYHLQGLLGNQSLRILGGVHAQARNLKRLTEAYHQKWIVRINLTQHGESYQVHTLE